MLTLLTFTILAGVLGQPSELVCDLQEGASWPSDPTHVAAVTCNGRMGFFTPSAEFRAMRKDEKAYDLIEQELRLAKFEIGALRQALAESEGVIQRWKDLAAQHRANWVSAEEDVQAMAEDVREAGERAWHESPALWVAVGVIVASAAVWAASELQSDPVLLNP